MRVLYHWPLDPASRQARLALSEKKIRVREDQIDPWNPQDSFLNITPEGAPPVFVDEMSGQRIVIAGARAITEYAEDRGEKGSLMPASPEQRAEARRIVDWFDRRFAEDVNTCLMLEKVEKRMSGEGAPNPAVMREGREMLAFHLEYMQWLLERRDWLACDSLSLADIAAGAHISCLDFIDEMVWDKYPAVTEWYQKLKSRPSFRPLLGDRVPGIVPPRHYADLDF